MSAGAPARSLLACLTAASEDGSRSNEVRAAAAALAKAAPPTPVSVGELSPPQQRALAEALPMRAADLLRFYGPVLEACKGGKTAAPVRDLRTAARLARALVDVSQGYGALVETAESLERWLPGGSTDRTAVRFDRSAPAVPPAPAVVQPETKEDRNVDRLLRLLVVVGLLGALVGGASWWLNRPPPPPPVDRYRAAVPEVLDKVVQGELVVVSVSATWLGQDEESRLLDLYALHDASAGDRVNGVEVQVDGRRVGLIDAEGRTRLSP